MEQFSLDKWLQDKSRKIITRNKRNVRIICTDSPDKEYPIVGFVEGDLEPQTWNLYGEYNNDLSNGSYDLFFADEEEELTEFEKRIYNLINFSDTDNCPSVEEVKEEAEILLDLAREELEANYYTKVIDDRMVFKSELHEQSLQTAYDMGKQDVLKDLPKWKKITEEKQNYLAYGYLSHDGYYLSIQELKDKLPKEE